MATYKLIGCKVFEREIASLTYKCKNTIDVTTVRLSLHSRPRSLNQAIQEEIDAIDANTHRYTNDAEYVEYDAILLGYGLCSYVSLGLCSKKYPLVIPRVHDCIAVLMGDRKWYDEYYAAHNRTFFGSCGYKESLNFSDKDRFDRRYLMYLERYKGNERKARRATELEMSFTSCYDNFTYIGWPNLEFPEYETQAQEYARSQGWSYEKIMGGDSILRRMFDGEWDERDFLVVPPGMCIGQSFDSDILKAMTQEEYWESRC